MGCNVSNAYIAASAQIADNTITGAKIAMGSDAAGDVLYYNGTDYVRLAAPTTTSKLLKGGSTPAWTGGLSVLDDETVAGSAVEEITMTGATLDTDVRYLLVAELKGDDATGRNLLLCYNGDHTTTNYYSEYLLADANVVSANIQNAAAIGSANNAYPYCFYAFIQQDPFGYPRAQIYGTIDPTATLSIIHRTHVWNSTTNPTSISIYCDTGAHIDVGSRLTLYRLGV